MTPATIIGLLIVIAIVVLIIRHIRKERKAGVCHCGVSCSSCGGACHCESETHTQR